MKLQEAFAKLHAPENITEFLMKTREGVPDKALVQEARHWVEKRIEENGEDYLRVENKRKTLLEKTEEYIRLLKEAKTLLFPKIFENTIPVPQARKACEKCLNMGYLLATITVIEADFAREFTREKRRELIEKVNAAGTIKERIDYLGAFYAVDKEGNIIIP